MFGWLNKPRRTRQDRSQAAAPEASEPTHEVQLDPQLVTVDHLGRTLVATVVESELTAPTVACLASDLRALLAQNRSIRNLVLDLQNVEYLDSSCLNMLVELLGFVRRQGGGVAIASAAHRIEVLFKLTRLDKVFPIRKNVLAAVDAVERA